MGKFAFAVRFGLKDFRLTKLNLFCRTDIILSRKYEDDVDFNKISRSYSFAAYLG